MCPPAASVGTLCTSLNTRSFIIIILYIMLSPHVNLVNHVVKLQIQGQSFCAGVNSAPATLNATEEFRS